MAFIIVVFERIPNPTVSFTLRDPIAQKIINAKMKDSLQKSMLQFSLQT